MLSRRSTPEAIPAWSVAPGRRARGPQPLSPALAGPAPEVPTAEPATPANLAAAATHPALASGSTPALSAGAGPTVVPARDAASSSASQLAHPPAPPAGPRMSPASWSALAGSTSAASVAEPLWVPATAAPEDPADQQHNRWRRRFPSPHINPTRDKVGSVERSLTSWEPVSVAEACGFAVRFAADYLSWDELEPRRRRAALRTYLADPDTADIGWPGHGRQRADLVTAGRTVILREGLVVVVEVTARVVVYHRVESAEESRRPAGEATPPLAFAPASAPPQTDPTWAPGASWWVRIAPPVRRDHDGHLVVDIGLDLTAQS
jgi:hypothetical protein